MSKAMTTGQVLVKMLCEYNVDTVFAMPGEQLDPFFAALYEERENIAVIHVRHEQGAAFMAYGYARATGRVGVFAIPPGPGFLNTTAALATGYAANAPMLCLTGQIPLHSIGRGYGILHEIPDQLSILQSLTKWSARMEHPSQGPTLIDEAFRQLRNGRCRPVGIEVPSDVMMQATRIKITKSNQDAIHHLILNEEDICQAAQMLSKAKQPLIMVGAGAVAAASELTAIAEMIQAPVVSNCSGRGILSERHYLSLTWPAGHALWKQADVVLAVGTRLFQPQHSWGVDESLQIIRIDIDPNEISRVCSPTLGIVADAKSALTKLQEKLLQLVSYKDSRQKELTALKKSFETNFSKLTPHYDYLMAIREALPDDAFFVDELTQVGYLSRFAYPVYQPRTYLSATYQGALGYGFPTALGVKVGNRERAVVSICGDGGFMYNVAELATAVLHQLAVIIIVFNDNAYGNVKRTQLSAGYHLGSDLHNPNFCQLAKTFGAVGIKATSLSALRKALQKALVNTGPTLIEVPVNEMSSPWKYIRLPRVRSMSQELLS